MKKISLLKSLALLGAVGLTSVCVVETALLLNKNITPQTDNAINLNAYNNYTLAHVIENPDNLKNAEIQILLKENGIQFNTETPIKFSNINDLSVVVDTNTKTFSITACDNSPTYVGGSNALIHYATPTKTDIVTIIGDNAVVYLDDKFEDETLTKKNILSSLQNQYPTLNINQLNVSWNEAYGQNGNAMVSVKDGSPLYSGNGIGVTYNTSGSISMALDKNVIKQGESATPTFKYHGDIATGTNLSYTCLASTLTTNFNFSTATGILTYINGNTPDFNGGAYVITASYTLAGNTYTASQIIFAQSNISKGELSISAPNINMGNKNTGTNTYVENGTTISTNLAYTIAPAVVAGQGLTFDTATGKLTWNGTSAVYAGSYIITCTHSGTGIKTTKATAIVTVADARDAKLTIANPIINNTTTNSGATTFKVNAATVTTTLAYAISPSAPSAQGLSFNTTTGVLTWNGTSATTGGTYTITGTYSPSGGIVSTAQCIVSVTSFNGPLVMLLDGVVSTWPQTYIDNGITTRQLGIKGFGSSTERNRYWYIKLGTTIDHNSCTMRINGRYVATKTDIIFVWNDNAEAPTLINGTKVLIANTTLTLGIAHGSSDGQIWLRYYVSDAQLNNLTIDVATYGIGSVPSITRTDPGYAWVDIPTA